MEGIALAWMSITQSEVNCNAQLNLTATEDVLQESVSLVENQVFESNILVPPASIQVELELAFSQLCNITTEVAQVHVFARLL